MFIERNQPQYPILGPTVKCLSLFKLLQTNLSWGSLFWNWLHVFDNLFVISQFVQLWIIKSDIDLAMINFALTMLNLICVLKSNSFLYWQKDWKSLLRDITNIERRQLSQKGKTTISIIKDYKKYTRIIMCLYWSLVSGIVFTIILTPIFEYLYYANCRQSIGNRTSLYPQIKSSWMPFDSSRGCGYFMSVLINVTACVFGGGVSASYDSNVVFIMLFLKGQLNILRYNCKNMFGKKAATVSRDEAMKRIKKYHAQHVELSSIRSRLNALVSPIMFMYAIIYSAVIAVCAVQVTKEGTTTPQIVCFIEYALALLAQLLLYCWHSNDVLYTSTKVLEGLYFSLWVQYDASIRHNVIMLGTQLKQEIVFTAGPITNLTMSSYFKIIGASYSFYTFLRHIRKFVPDGAE